MAGIEEGLERRWRRWRTNCAHDEGVHREDRIGSYPRLSGGLRSQPVRELPGDHSWSWHRPDGRLERGVGIPREPGSRTTRLDERLLAGEIPPLEQGQRLRLEPSSSLL